MTKTEHDNPPPQFQLFYGGSLSLGHYIWHKHRHGSRELGLPTLVWEFPEDLEAEPVEGWNLGMAGSCTVIRSFSCARMSSQGAVSPITICSCSRVGRELAEIRALFLCQQRCLLSHPVCLYLLKYLHPGFLPRKGLETAYTKPYIKKQGLANQRNHSTENQLKTRLRT